MQATRRSSPASDAVHSGNLHARPRWGCLLERDGGWGVGAQIFSSDTVQSSGGVYWMFYAGSSFEEAPAPAGLPGLEAGAAAEGLRCASRVLS